MSMIENGIDEIMKRYCGNTNANYSSVRLPDDSESISHLVCMRDELREYLKTTGIPFELQEDIGCSKGYYVYSFIAITWLEDAELKLKTCVLKTI